MKRNNRMRTVLIVVALVVGAGALLAVIRSRAAQDESGLTTVTIERRTLEETLVATGVMRPEQSHALAFEVAGTVKDVRVREGDSVKAGDVLARLESSDLERAVEQARQAVIIQQAAYDTLVKGADAGDLAKARAAVAQAESALFGARTAVDNRPDQLTVSCTALATLEQALQSAQDVYRNYLAEGYRYDAEFEPDPDSPAGKAFRAAHDQLDLASANCNMTRRAQGSDSALNAAEAALEQAQETLRTLEAGATPEQLQASLAQLEQAKLNLATAEANLKRASLIAPVNGVISTLSVNPGQSVVKGGAPVVIMEDTSALHLKVNVDENDILSVDVGQPARYTLQGAKRESGAFAAVVSRKDPVGRNSGGIVVYTVWLDPQDDAAPEFLNMTADVEIVLTAHTDALVVPAAALRRDEAGAYFLRIVDSEGATADLPVTTGLTESGFTEVRGDGLREGLAVLIGEPAKRRGGLLSGLFSGMNGK